MGVGSLVAPLVAPKLLGPLTPGKGRFGQVLVRTALAAAAVTTAADYVARRSEVPKSRRPACRGRHDGRHDGRREKPWTSELR